MDAGGFHRSRTVRTYIIQVLLPAHHNRYACLHIRPIDISIYLAPPTYIYIPSTQSSCISVTILALPRAGCSLTLKSFSPQCSLLNCAVHAPRLIPEAVLHIYISLSRSSNPLHPHPRFPRLRSPQCRPCRCYRNSSCRDESTQLPGYISITYILPRGILILLVLLLVLPESLGRST